MGAPKPEPQVDTKMLVLHIPDTAGVSDTSCNIYLKMILVIVEAAIVHGRYMTVTGASIPAVLEGEVRE